MAIYQLANLVSSNNTFTGTNTFNNIITGTTSGNLVMSDIDDLPTGSLSTEETGNIYDYNGQEE